MPNCKLCHKALATGTDDALCENCRAMQEHMRQEDAQRARLSHMNRRDGLILLGLLCAIFLGYQLISGIGNQNSAALAEQLVIETVQKELGYTPAASGAVAFETPVSKIVIVRYGLTKASLNAEDCPIYFISVSGKKAEIMPLAEPQDAAAQVLPPPTAGFSLASLLPL